MGDGRSPRESIFQTCRALIFNSLARPFTVNSSVEFAPLVSRSFAIRHISSGFGHRIFASCALKVLLHVVIALADLTERVPLKALALQGFIPGLVV